MTGETRTSTKIFRKPKDTYIPRLMPVGAIIILLMILIPVLREERRDRQALSAVDPPLPMAVYSTGHARLDSLANEGLRSFGRREYDHAARLLAEAHFHWTVMMRERGTERYPEDLRFYFGLAHLYRGRPDLAAPLLEAEERDGAFEAKYPWYLAHVYLALARPGDARTALERVVAIGGDFAEEARAAIARLDESPMPDTAR